MDETLLYALNFRRSPELERNVDLLNAAASDQKFVEFRYTREEAGASAGTLLLGRLVDVGVVV